MNTWRTELSYVHATKIVFNGAVEKESGYNDSELGFFCSQIM